MFYRFQYYKSMVNRQLFFFLVLSNQLLYMLFNCFFTRETPVLKPPFCFDIRPFALLPTKCIFKIFFRNYFLKLQFIFQFSDFVDFFLFQHINRKVENPKYKLKILSCKKIIGIYYTMNQKNRSPKWIKHNFWSS